MFYVGQKVVCINDTFNDPMWKECAPNRPVRGNVYTIREIVKYLAEIDWQEIELVEGLLLQELINPEFEWIDGIGECPFVTYKFVPLDKDFIHAQEQQELVESN